jgi:hypothetical protein
MVQNVEGHIMAIGTPMTDYDLLSRLHQPESGYITSKVPIIKDGKPTWEWRFPIEKIEDIQKNMTEIQYAREYLCQIISEESQAIDNKALIRCLDPEQTLHTNLFQDGLPRQNSEGNPYIPYRVTGQDLAMSSQGDYTVSITLEQQPNGQWLLLHMDRKRGMNFQGHLEWIPPIYNTFKPQRIALDKAQFGQALIDQIQITAGIPAEPFLFNPNNRKEAIAKTIQMIEANKLIIPRNQNDPYTMQMTDQLIRELTNLIPTKTPTGINTYTCTTKHDDCLMALAIACSLTPTELDGATSFYMKKW